MNTFHKFLTQAPSSKLTFPYHTSHLEHARRPWTSRAQVRPHTRSFPFLALSHALRVLLYHHTSHLEHARRPWTSRAQACGDPDLDLAPHCFFFCTRPNPPVHRLSFSTVGGTSPFGLLINKRELPHLVHSRKVPLREAATMPQRTRHVRSSVRCPCLWHY